MSRFECTPTPLGGLTVVLRSALEDSRGFLSRLYCADELRAAGWRGDVAQVNHTLTRRQGSVRGLHFQRAPHAEAKLVSCVRGEVFDVAVDLRRGSPTYLQWHAQRLSAQNRHSLLIPRGFAHGFQALADDCELIYLHSSAYTPEAEGGLDALDAALAIAWPLPVVERSPRDLSFAAIDENFEARFDATPDDRPNPRPSS